jgi:hypothetical protein
MATRGGRRPRFEPSMATRGRRRPRLAPRSRLEEGAGRSTLTLRKVRAVLELRHPVKTARRIAPPHRLHRLQATRGRVGTTITTRGGCRTQHANSAQGAGRPRITTPSQNRKKGRGWHHDSDSRRGADHSTLDDKGSYPPTCMYRLRAVLELRHPVKTARRGGVGTPIEGAGAPFW